jgi:Flp pilus assembly protein TadG
MAEMIKMSHSVTRFKYKGSPRLRESGTILAWGVMLMIVGIGAASLVVDVGFIQRQRARMQNTCDAAALAGAKQLPNADTALTKARDMSSKNGYTHGESGVTLTGKQNPDGLHPGYYKVTLSKPINFFLAPIMGYKNGTITMSATAEYTSPLPIYISATTGQYGVNGIENLSSFGPYGEYDYGDCYSTRWLNNGQSNPNYQPNGYDFFVNVGNDYFAKNGTNQVCFQVYDPDCWNVGDAPDAGTGKVDEIRDAPGSPHPQPSSKYDTTVFKLYAPDNTPDNFDDDILIASATYTPSSHTTDLKWVTPSGFQINLATYGYGRYRMNEQTTNGSSENGFNFRAGAPAKVVDPPSNWNPNNGTAITAVGSLPINFNVSGTVDINFGYIPSAAAGSNVYVNKFDTDVGAQSVSYYDDLGNHWSGTLATNGTFKLDTLVIPKNYPGSVLHAKYTAGSQDTSVWMMYMDGRLTGVPGVLKLVD